ncbi:hypothetical protein FQR65_LT04520 [Abscondita terminalis]|nr:hypothetical protein FQR65_LT04520 [Abscondita terminalis]
MVYKMNLRHELSVFISTFKQHLPHASCSLHIVKKKMNFKFANVMAIAVIAILVVTFVSMTEATYRKPPFNGSIFGKRGVTSEYDNANKALSALCEIAFDACQPWFPSQEK